MADAKKEETHAAAPKKAQKAFAKALEKLETAAENKNGTEYIQALGELQCCCDEGAHKGGKVRGATAEADPDDLDKCIAAVEKFERSISGGTERARAAAGASQINPELLLLAIQFGKALLDWFRNRNA